jgi:hypothetical protein
MGHEAIPIMRAHNEEGRKRPKGGKEFVDAMEKRIKDIKDRSALEKKKCSLSYRHYLEWSGIDSQEEFDKKRKETAENYCNGNFFLERIGRLRSVDDSLTLTVLFLRKQWIREYEVETIPEFILLDMAMVSYFHFIRLNEDVNNALANIEWQMFALDAPMFMKNSYGDRLSSERNDKAVAEEIAHNLQEVLQPVLDKFNRMFIRNLKAMRDLRRGNIQLNIGNVGQLNVGDKQINVDKQDNDSSQQDKNDV